MKRVVTHEQKCIIHFITNDKHLRQIQLVLYLLPFLILTGIFSYAPLFGWTYAFIDYIPGVPIFEHSFVGLKHFKVIFAGASDFAIVMRNTLAISLLGLATTPIPIIFAIMISEVRSTKYSRTIQTVTSIPNFISWVLVYSIVFIFFSSEDGAINRLFLSLGFIDKPLNPLGNSDVAWYFQTAIGIWKSTGWNSIIYLAAIAGIDQELYNAAEIDGAGRWQKICHITIPGILPTYLVLLLLAISSMLSNGFEQYWMFQNGLTIDKLEVFDTYVYRLGIINMQYSFSTAMGIFKTIVSVILLSIANVASKHIRGTKMF